MIRGLQEPLQPTTIEQWIFKMIKHDNYKKDILLQKIDLKLQMLFSDQI